MKNWYQLSNLSVEEVVDEVDEKGHPKQRIALLHGPPGLGKTTLAHIVAKHAGYNVVEMNASDDRSVEAFKVKLEAATQVNICFTAKKFILKSSLIF